MPPKLSGKRYGRVLPELRMLAGEVPVGTTSRGVCPFCRGGTSGETSFALTRVDAATTKYFCHRASCGAHGTISGAHSSIAFVGQQGTDLRGERQDGYTGDLQRLGKEWLSVLNNGYGLDADVCSRFGWMEEVVQGGLVVYIRSPEGVERGVHVRRRPSSLHGPKTRDYRGDPLVNWMGWFSTDGGRRAGDGDLCVAVEDVLSAAKVAQAGFLAVALMGCALTLDKLSEALKVCGKDGRLVLALDRDATGKAIDFSSQYSFLSAGRLVPMLIRKDLKYHTEEEIQEMVHGITRP